MTNEINMGAVAGRYKLTVLRADGSVKHDGEWFDNLILNAGLNRMGTGSIGTYAVVGSGAGAPVATETALKVQVASTSDVQAEASGALASSPYYGWHRKTFRFPAGKAAGNLSEVGIAGYGAPLFSRALIRDSNGDPTTITVLSDEVLDVTYELRVYPPLADVSNNVTIDGVVYACLARASFLGAGGWIATHLLNYSTFESPNYFVVSAYDGTIGAVTEQPNGVSASGGSCVVKAYSNNSLERQIEATWDLNNGNLKNGIRSVFLSPAYQTLGAYQFQFTPAIPKDATKILKLTFKYTWSRKT